MRYFLVYFVLFSLCLSPAVTGSEMAQGRNSQDVSMSTQTMQSADANEDCTHHQMVIKATHHDCCDKGGSMLLDDECSGQCGDCEKGASALVNSVSHPSYIAPDKQLGLSLTFNNPPQQQVIIPPIQ